MCVRCLFHKQIAEPPIFLVCGEYQDLEYENGINKLEIKQIRTMDKQGRVQIDLICDLDFNLNDCEASEDFNEDEYCEEFNIAFNQWDCTRLKELLHKAECEESLKIYDSIAQYHNTNQV